MTQKQIKLKNCWPFLKCHLIFEKLWLKIEEGAFLEGCRPFREFLDPSLQMVLSKLAQLTSFCIISKTITNLKKF